MLYESFRAIDDGGMSSVWQDTCLKKRKSNYNNTKTTKKIKKLKISTREAVLTNYAVFNNHTLVQHAVGNHRDIFGKWQSKNRTAVLHSLENRLCFANKSLFNEYGVGRGGAGTGVFVFGILDWQGKTNGKCHKTILTNLRDSKIPHNVTDECWKNFRKEHPDAAKAVDLIPG